MSNQGIESIGAIAGRIRTVPAELPPIGAKTRGERPEDRAAKQAEADPVVTIGTRRLEGMLTQTYVRFIVDNETRQIRVQVLDANSDQIIREIPTEELAKLAADLRAYNQAALEHRR